MPEMLGEKFKSESFSFWVDNKTGILLKAKTYDASGQAIKGLDVLDITIKDKGIEKTWKTFQADTKGYEKVAY